MGNTLWTEKDSLGFSALVKNSIKDYQNIQGLTEAHNALAEVKRSPGAIAFRLRSFLDSNCFVGATKEHVESMLYVFYSSLPKKEKKAAVAPSVPLVGTALPQWKAPFNVTESPNWWTAKMCADHFGYSTSWVEQLAERNKIQRVDGNYYNTRGRLVEGWLYSVESIVKYLQQVKAVPPEHRRNGKVKVLGRVTVCGPSPSPFPWMNDKDTNRERLLKLYKAGKVDAVTTLDILEKL